MSNIAGFPDVTDLYIYIYIYIYILKNCRRKKENERLFGEQLPEQVEGLLPEDDSDDELLSSVLK